MDELNEIIEFYYEGMSVVQIAEATGYSIYKLNKMLSTVPISPPPGYFWNLQFPQK